MKRIGGLFDRICDRRNLALATWKASRGKRLRKEVVCFFNEVEEELESLSQLLRSGRYCFSSYRCFSVRDTKTREIHAPHFRDRVVHHAIINVCGEAFQRGSIFHSYACRKGKGQHLALKQAIKFTGKYSWYGKFDIRKFYDSVDHRVLALLLKKRFREQKLLALFDNLIASYEVSPGRGIPIGALSSQYFGNFYLDELDRSFFRNKPVSAYIRYMDDVVVWGTRDDVFQFKSLLEEPLSRLKLAIKHDGEWNQSERGIPFLGFIIYPNRVRLGKAGRKRLRVKTRTLQKQWFKGEIGEAELQARGQSLFAHAKWGDDAAWRLSMLRTVPLDGYFGEMLEIEPCHTRRLLEQHGQELSFSVSQQEDARQPQQESGLPCGFVSRHEGSMLTDDASSRPQDAKFRGETIGKPTVGVDILRSLNGEEREEKIPTVAPFFEKGGVE